jgi:hypothetical protein
VPEFISTKLLRMVDYATEKGGEDMEELESKGNVMDVIVRASNERDFRNRLLHEVYHGGEGGEPYQDPLDLLSNFFYKEKYFDVSFEDCEKMLEVATCGPPSTPDLETMCKFPDDRY